VQVPAWGGDPGALFLSGHSAGAWLTARLGLDPELQAHHGLALDTICELIPVSGAAYDLADQETYALGASHSYFVDHFDDGRPDWQTRASVVPLARPDGPPTLVLYGGGEQPKFQRQNELLVQALEAQDARIESGGVPGEDHSRMVLTLSRDGKRRTATMRDFMSRSDCG